MNKHPLVSIVIPTYNRAKWVCQAIESAMQQDYPNLEIIVNDDCSQDNTEQIIKQYETDPRVKLFKNEKNLGLIGNFNKVYFDLAKGDYVTLLGSDDYFVNPTFISKSVNIINRYENVSIVFGKTAVLNETTQKVKPTDSTFRFDTEFKKGLDVFLDFADNPYYSSGAVLYSMKHLKANNITFLGRITSDLEMNLQIMQFGNVGYINEVIYMVRQHTNNASDSFKTLEELEFSYLDLVRFLYRKAEVHLERKPGLSKWYNKVMHTNIQLCMRMILYRNNRKLSYAFHKLMVSKYKKEYVRFFLKEPKFILKVILNR